LDPPPDYQAVYRLTALAQQADDSEEIVMPLEAREAPREREHARIEQLRVGLVPVAQPLVVRAVTEREGPGIDTAMNQAQFSRVALWVVVEHVAAHGVGNDDDAFAAGDDRAVATDRVQAVHGAHEAWPRCRVHAAPGEPHEPRGHPRAQVHDVEGRFAEPAAQRRHVA
jgi:hypothetical protein